MSTVPPATARPRTASLDPTLHPTPHPTLPALMPMEIVYRDQKGAISHRLIAPLAYVGEPAAGKIVAWCFLRSELRHFLRTNVVQFKRVQLTEPEQAQVTLARELLAKQQAAQAAQAAQRQAEQAALFQHVTQTFTF